MGRPFGLVQVNWARSRHFMKKNWKTSYRFFFFIGLVPVPIEDIKVSHFSNEMFHIGPVLGSIKDSQSRGPDGKVQ